jgi:hypothetical protein
VLQFFRIYNMPSDINSFIDSAIATITGTQPSNFWTYIRRFFVNRIPFLGEIHKVRKVAKLFKVIDEILDSVQTFKNLNVPGAGNLLRRMTIEADLFKEAMKVTDLSKATAVFGRLLGFLREAQMASALKGAGANVIQVGKNIKIGKRVITEVDIVTEKSGQIVYNQVKAGKRAILTPGSTKWPEFTKQVDETVRAAVDVGAKVLYYVDDISDEANIYLTRKGIEILRTLEILK